MAYTCTIRESFSCRLILAAALKPSGISLLHCCHKQCLRLKECLSPLFLSALMMTHTPAHPAEISSHAPEREKEEWDLFFFFASNTHNSCSCVLIYLPCLHKYLYSSAFPVVPCRVEIQLVLSHCKTLECVMHLLGKPFSYLQPRGFRGTFKSTNCI